MFDKTDGSSAETPVCRQAGNFLRDSRIAGASIDASSTCGGRSCAGHHFFCAPGFVVANHAVQDGQQFSHAGYQRHFLFLTASDQSSVERFDDWVVSGRDQRCHVQHAANMTAASGDGSLFITLSGLIHDGSHPGQLRNFTAIQFVEFVF